MNGRIFLLTLAFMLVLASMQALASDRSMRCGRHLIHAGGFNSPGMYEVLKKCGEPEAKNGNIWIYVQGNASRTLTFNAEGRLMRIESRRG